MTTNAYALRRDDGVLYRQVWVPSRGTWVLEALKIMRPSRRWRRRGPARRPHRPVTRRR
jgi:hypothetical protein